MRRERAPQSLHVCSGSGWAAGVRHVAQHLLDKVTGVQEGGRVLDVRWLDDERASVTDGLQGAQDGVNTIRDGLNLSTFLPSILRPDGLTTSIFLP
jgi:hypothetical protein